MTIATPSGLLVRSLAYAFAIWAGCNATAAYIPIYGGPEYASSAHTGYISPNQSFAMGNAVNNSGTAVGWALRVDSGVHSGTRALRWDSSGRSGAELDHLGTGTDGRTIAIAHAVNDSGIAVGHANTYFSGRNYGYRAARWDHSGTVATKLGNLGTGSDGYTTVSSANDVNDAGTAVGYAAKYEMGIGYGWRAVRWDGSGTTATELGNLGTNSRGDTHSSANAVNESDTAVGRAIKHVSGTSYGYRAVRWDGTGTSATELENLGTDSNGVTSSEAYAVNASGTAVGFAKKYVLETDYGERAARWDSSGTGATELESLGTDSSGTTRSRASAVNDSGTAVGFALKYVSEAYYGIRAVRWDSSGMGVTELGHLGTDGNGITESLARTVNNSGIAVGYADKYVDGNLVDRRAVAWKSDSLAIDLNTLIDPASGWTLRDAYGISDTRWISGTGDFDPDGPGGELAYSRLFVMQIPEPTSLLLAAMSLTSTLAYVRHRALTRCVLAKSWLGRDTNKMKTKCDVLFGIRTSQR